MLEENWQEVLEMQRDAEPSFHSMITMSNLYTEKEGKKMELRRQKRGSLRK